jgi:hypothetical protein
MVSHVRNLNPQLHHCKNLKTHIWVTFVVWPHGEENLQRLLEFLNHMCQDISSPYPSIGLLTSPKSVTLFTFVGRSRVIVVSDILDKEVHYVAENLSPRLIQYGNTDEVFLYGYDKGELFKKTRD